MSDGGFGRHDLFRLFRLFRNLGQILMGRYLDLAKAVEAADICGKVAPGTPEVSLAEAVPPKVGESVGPASFESDRECEISELCEISPLSRSYEINEKSPVGAVPLCPPGGRAVLLQAPGGVPDEWTQGVADLLAMSPHPGWPEPAWKTLQEDALTFLKNWAAQAHALGWAAADLFSVHAEAPRARLDGMGLVPLLVGRPVVALTADSAAITAASGGTLTYRKRKVWPVGCCLLWDLEGLP